MSKHITITTLRITLFAFIINALLPFFAIYNISSNSAEASEISSVFGDKILICTSEGFKWISLEELKKEKKIPAKHPKYKCAICFISNTDDNNSFLSGFPVIYATYHESKHYKFYKLDLLGNQSFYLISPSRAPPLYS